MEMTETQKTIWLTFFTDAKTEKLTAVYPVLSPVLAGVHFGDYGMPGWELVLALVAFSPDTRPQSDKLLIRPTKNEIEIRYNIDYPALCAAQGDAVVRLAAGAILSAVERLVLPRPELHGQPLLDALKAAFAQAGISL